MWCCALLFCHVLCDVMLCNAVLYCVVLCCFMQCFAEHLCYTNIKAEAKKESVTRRMQRWQAKPLHGQYSKRVNEVDVDKKYTHQWVSSTGLKGETEGFILAAQDQSLPTRNYQANILHTGVDPRCRLCAEKVETIDHIVSGCSKLANTEYKMKHDRLGQYLHWNICNHYDMPTPKHWYEHHRQPVTEGKSATILWYTH